MPVTKVGPKIRRSSVWIGTKRVRKVNDRRIATVSWNWNKVCSLGVDVCWHWSVCVGSDNDDDEEEFRRFEHEQIRKGVSSKISGMAAIDSLASSSAPISQVGAIRRKISSYAFFFLTRWSSHSHTREPGEEICVLFLAFPIEKQIQCHIAGWSPTDGRGNRSWFTSCRIATGDLRSDSMSTAWFVGFLEDLRFGSPDCLLLRLFSISESKKKHQTEYEKIRQAFDTSQNSLEKNTIDYPRMEKAYQFYQKCRAFVHSFLECYNEKVGPYPSI